MTVSAAIGLVLLAAGIFSFALGFSHHTHEWQEISSPFAWMFMLAGFLAAAYGAVILIMNLLGGP
jgi:uncharacterized membrane protein HdeD (DUF308 family)